MGAKDPRVSAYVARSAPFAKPILTLLRSVVHDACPEVEETIKWGFPVFQYKGMLANMASFKSHVSFGFWKADLVLGDAANREAMGQFGRITMPGDLPSLTKMKALIKVAAKLNEQGVKSPKRLALKTRPRVELPVPPYLSTALAKDKKAYAHFQAMSPSHKKEYVEWITEAKGQDTRERRMKTALAWLAEGKSRNWKYERS